MKKNLSVLLITMLAFSMVLAACAGTPTPAPTTPTPVRVNPYLILGTWIDDATGIEWTYGDDGSLGSTSRVIAKFAFDGYQLKITNWDGKVITPTVVIDGDKMVETAGDGTITHFTRKKK